MRYLMRWAPVLALMICGTMAQAQPPAADGQADGPRVFLAIGTERQNGDEAVDKLILRGGGGFEWPGVFGWQDTYFLGQYIKAGWGDSEIQAVDRWHWAVKSFMTGYWDNANPYLAVGVEHSGESLIVGQRNVTWFSLGLEPEFAHGWIQIALEGTGWLMEDVNCWRFGIDLIPGNLQ